MRRAGFGAATRRANATTTSSRWPSSRLAEVEGKRDGLVREARSEVGIWSTIGVGEVRGLFWNAWERGEMQLTVTVKKYKLILILILLLFDALILLVLLCSLLDLELEGE